MTVKPIEWQPLPTLWPDPAAWTDVGELMLLVFSPDGVPTWEVRRRTKVGRSDDDLIASGTADTFEAAKAAALFEATAHSHGTHTPARPPPSLHRQPDLRRVSASQHPSLDDGHRLARIGLRAPSSGANFRVSDATNCR
jgi:hypothetical protein